MKKQMMTALAVSAMMTLAMPFASFAASRSCQTGFRPRKQLWIHNWHQRLFYGPDAGRMRDFQWKCYWSLYVIRGRDIQAGGWK